MLFLFKTYTFPIAFYLITYTFPMTFLSCATLTFNNNLYHCDIIRYCQALRTLSLIYVPSMGMFDSQYGNNIFPVWE